MLALQSHCTAEMLREEGTRSGKGPTGVAPQCLHHSTRTSSVCRPNPPTHNSLLAGAGRFSKTRFTQGQQKLSTNFWQPVRGNIYFLSLVSTCTSSFTFLSPSGCSTAAPSFLAPSLHAREAIRSPPKSFQLHLLSVAVTRRFKTSGCWGVLLPGFPSSVLRTHSLRPQSPLLCPTAPPGSEWAPPPAPRSALGTTATASTTSLFSPSPLKQPSDHKGLI